MLEKCEVVRECKNCTCGMRAVKKVGMQFGKGESCWGSVTVVDHG